MVNRSDAHSQLAELFKQQKCYRIDELSRRLNYSLISIRRFLKVIGYYSSFTQRYLVLSRYWLLQAWQFESNN